MKTIKVDKVILYYMDRVDPDGNLYRFYVSVEAVEYLTGPKEYSREQAFNIIREWAKEFTEKYGNYDFDGSYYDEIDEFIDKKLGTI